MSLTPSSLAPLFGALPGGVELLLVGLLSFVVPVALALYVGLDARDQTDHPFAWGLTTFLAGFSPFFIGAIAVTVLYRLSREELGSVAPPTFGESDMPDDAEVLGQSLGAQRAETAERPATDAGTDDEAGADEPTDDGTGESTDDEPGEPTDDEPDQSTHDEADDASGVDTEANDERDDAN